ncbi:hypothetical protein HCN44_001068 [Aphidius gifuensis]|uniref:Odorant receptor n=1 Tax=Aphidius gifuensis TaxID=684658 RepID=A0A834XNL0_APHGI|nr:hypothetical protein HCN44_001068 [Aphidius gifuensis]
MAFFSTSLMFFKLSGVWIPQTLNNWQLKLYKFYTVAMMTMQLIFMILQFLTLAFKESRKIWNPTKVVMMGMSIAINFIKGSNILLCRNNIMKIFKDLKNDPFLPQNENEENIIKKYKTNTKQITLICTIYTVSSTMLFSLRLLIFTKPPKLSLSIGFPYDIDNFILFKLITIFQLLLVWINTLIALGYDILFLDMMMITSSQIKILSYRYKNKILSQTIDNNYTNNNFMKNVIVSFVEHHLEILKLTDNLKNIFSIPIFIQYLNSTMKICLAAYYASNMNYLSIRFMSMIFIFINYIVQISIICLSCDEVKIQFEKLSYAIYDVDWTSFDIKTRRSMIILMIKTSKPFIFKFGGFFEPSRESLTNVCITNYNYNKVSKSIVN